MAPAKHIRRVRLRPKKYSREYFIWCEESDQSGKLFSNFYGGVLVKSEDLAEVIYTLENTCKRLYLLDEIKWHKISKHYVDKYTEIMDVFFDLVIKGKVKVRIMFTKNIYKTTHLHNGHKRDDFFMLYYQFIKHAFGFEYSNGSKNEIFLRLHFDILPYSLDRRRLFKEYIKNLQASRPFQRAGIRLRKQDITEVDSKKHLLLQMLDVVLGAVCFRLNNKHKELLPGKKRRSKRNKAKEKVDKHIIEKIRTIRKGFNMGMSTGSTSKEDHCHHAYRHWRFLSAKSDTDNTFFK
jgi:hypothetical protein